MSNQKHIVCPGCHAINRLPVARLAHNPNCGKCHRPLFGTPCVELAAGNFERHIGRNDIPVVVDFWAPWCGPCKTMAPAFEKARAQMEPAVRFAKLNTDAELTIAGRFNIRSIPTMALFMAGKEVARQSGALSAAQIVGWVRAQTGT